ncbi:MAG: hypothetical protein B5M51_06760 [Anaerolinea sp. 4484_236]|nr:MAG: hypothetical protein B5M51_06760 [Anaerolinea sp. 4484_236]
MKFDRVPWHLLIGLVLGLGLGLLISWIIAPVEYVDTPPALLRSDFKDQYRAMIASAYLSTGDLARAQMRLALLEDPDPVEALTVQAQRALAEGDSTISLPALAKLTADLQGERGSDLITPTSTRFLTQTPVPRTRTGTPSILSTQTTSTPAPATSTLTPVPVNSRTPKPTITTAPTLGAPYILESRDEICSTNISEGLLMVYVSNAAKKTVPGVEIIVAWSDGEEHFFTGFKPELGHGYADFSMDPNTVYSLRLPDGGISISNLSAPPCQDSSGGHYWGSLRLRFQQP